MATVGLVSHVGTLLSTLRIQNGFSSMNGCKPLLGMVVIVTALFTTGHTRAQISAVLALNKIGYSCELVQKVQSLQLSIRLPALNAVKTVLRQSLPM